MRRPLTDLAPSTVQTYRSRARKLWLKVQAGQATNADHLELAELETLLGVCGSDIPPVGRPRKYREGVPGLAPRQSAAKRGKAAHRV